MSHLSKLKIVAQQQKRMQSKTEHRRGKLLEKLDEDLYEPQRIAAAADAARLVFSCFQGAGAHYLERRF